MSTTVCTHCKGTGFCNSSSDGCRMSFMEKHQNECLHNDPLIPCQFCQGNGVIDKEEPQAITSDGDREEMSDADWEGVSLASYFLNYWQSKLFSLLVFICAIFIPAFPNGYWILDSTLTPSQRIVIIISFAVLLAFINWSENLWHAIIPLKKAIPPTDT